MRTILETENEKIGEPPIITKEEEAERWSKIKCSTKGIKKYASLFV